MRRPKGDISEWMEFYRERAGLDPLRAVLDTRDPDNRRNEYLDAVERFHLARILRAGWGGTAVELGCGVGRLLPLLGTAADRVIGVDASPDLLRAAKARDLGGRVRLVRGDLREVPLASGTVGFLLTSGALIHCVEDEDLELTAVEVRRLLRPGGRAVFVEHLSAGAVSEAREGILYRSQDEFLRPFRTAGLTIESSAPIRKCPSRLVHWVRQGRFPRALWGVAARLEPWLATKGREPPEYRDHVIVLRA